MLEGAWIQNGSRDRQHGQQPRLQLLVDAVKIQFQQHTLNPELEVEKIQSAEVRVYRIDAGEWWTGVGPPESNFWFFRLSWTWNIVPDEVVSSLFFQIWNLGFGINFGFLKFGNWKLSCTVDLATSVQETRSTRRNHGCIYLLLSLNSPGKDYYLHFKTENPFTSERIGCDTNSWTTWFAWRKQKQQFCASESMDSFSRPTLFPYANAIYWFRLGQFQK